MDAEIVHMYGSITYTAKGLGRNHHGHLAGYSECSIKRSFRPRDVTEEVGRSCQVRTLF